MQALAAFRDARISRALRLAVAVAALAVAGCAGTPRFDGTSLPAVELDDVPFFPQTDYQCGPAALATILAHEGLPVDADALVPAVYIEGLRGSLQAELLAATRRHGLVPYRLRPDPDALLAEVSSGKPVLVLQNLGLDRFPVWHYAVVVGFDPSRGDVLLRSGTERRRRERVSRFLRSWARAGYWAFVAAAPDEPPVTADADGWIRAVTDAAHVLAPSSADAALRAATSRWPTAPIVMYASAVRLGEAGRWQDAARAYAALLESDPGNAAARNNLANMLAEGGCFDEALRQARAALASVRADSPLRPAIEDTVATLLRRSDGAAVEPDSCASFP
ncbi:MAG TPA: PA2778 family cysteine peptidase [Gammaproteobacteria bacterium]